MTEEKKAFYEKYSKYAIENQQKYGIPASVTLAQACLESTFGTSGCTKKTNNFFGIHADKSWLRAGKPNMMFDDRGMVAFRAYRDARESFEDHARFLMENRRYRACFNLDSTDHLGWAKGIKNAGYAAMDRPYAESIENEIKHYGLDKYDRIAVQTATHPIGYMRSFQRGSGGSTPDVSASRSPAAVDGVRQGGGSAFLTHLPLQRENGVVTVGDQYNKAPTPYRKHVHNGIDVRGTLGEPVYSMERGTVVAVKTNMTEHDPQSVRQAKGNMGGNYVIVEYPRADGSSYRVSYCHLTENGVAVKKGDSVEAGQVIGYVGSTGNSTGAHLHLTVKHQVAGKGYELVDPLNYLAELSVAGSASINAVDKRTHQDLLASKKKELSYDSVMASIPASQREQDTAAALLAEQNQDAAAGQTEEDLMTRLSKCGDIQEMLQCMMSSSSKDGMSMEDMGFGGMFQSLVSTLFSAGIMMAFSLDASSKGQNVSNDGAAVDNSEDLAMDAASVEERAIHRHRDTVDVNEARQMMSVNFDSEYPEHQRGNGMKIS